MKKPPQASQHKDVKYGTRPGVTRGVKRSGDDQEKEGLDDRSNNRRENEALTEWRY
jgi:hypothetical protein